MTKIKNISAKSLIDTKIEIYQTANGNIKVEVPITEDTVWLSLNQLEEVFARDKSVISRHIKNIYRDEQLDKKSTVAKFATVQIEGERKIERVIEYYNLDLILAVGYRVNSKQGVLFRKWASNVLKEYLLKGYSINQERVIQDKLSKLSQTVELLSNTLINHNLVTEAGIEIISLIQSYSRTWHVLVKYDEETLEIPSSLHIINTRIITYDQAVEAIKSLKLELAKEEMVSSLFGLEKDKGLESILSNIEQTYDGQDLYKTVEEKAAHLLYYTIKDHPFNDGNKRIGSLLFLMYLNKAGISLKILTPNSMVSIALLVAESNPLQKELMIKLIINLIVTQ